MRQSSRNDWSVSSATFTINVWAGINGNRLLWSVLLSQHLIKETYLAFLQSMLPPLLENMPLAIQQTTGCSTMEGKPTSALMFTNTSTTSSPDVGYNVEALLHGLLNLQIKPPGFLFVVASKKHCVGWACPCSLQQHVHIACDAIQTQHETFEWVRESMMWCVHTCIVSHVGHLNICWHMDGIQAMYFVWCCSAVPSTVETMNFWTQGDINVYAPFPVRNHPLKFVGGLKTHSV